MARWPVIDERLLLERFAMEHDEYLAFLSEYIATAPVREYTPELHARATGYPYERPARSYVMEAGAVTPLAELDDPSREAVLARYTSPESGRVPLLAIGSNGAPGTLKLKFAHFPAAADRDVLVLTGHLHDHDIGPQAGATAYGSMPATIFASPGTRVRASLVWLTHTQFIQLLWSEVSYHLGRLTARFAGDEPGTDADAVLVFVSRFGTFAPEGEPLALAAVPAIGRTARAVTQEEALTLAARVAYGPEATAEDLLREIFVSAVTVLHERGPAIRALGIPFVSDAFERYPLPTEPAGPAD